MFVIIEDNFVVTTGVEKNQFPMAVDAPNDIVFGDHYINGVWVRDGHREPDNVLAPAEQREQAYETLACIEWQGDNITVDAANDLWLKYSAEDNAIATQLSTLIATAKTAIREQYPDEEVIENE